MRSATMVAKMTDGPIKPTILEPTVKSPTPMTEPAVIVTASRMPKLRLSAGELLMSLMKVSDFLFLVCRFS